MYPQKQQYAYAGYPPPQAYPAGPYYHGSQYGPYNYWASDQMRDLVAAHFANAPAPQAPARNDSPDINRTQHSPGTYDTYNSHRKIKRPKIGDRKVYRPVRRHTLSRIDEAPQQARPRSKSLQHSADFSSTRRILRSRSNISADTSRSVPVCNESQEVGNQLESNSPQYAEPNRNSDSRSSYDDRPVSMTDLPIMVPIDPATGAYIPYPEYTYYHDDGCRLNRFRKKRKLKNLSSKSNLYLAFMY